MNPLNEYGDVIKIKETRNKIISEMKHSINSAELFKTEKLNVYI